LVPYFFFLCPPKNKTTRSLIPKYYFFKLA
jgi:hypothetical protein